MGKLGVVDGMIVVKMCWLGMGVVKGVVVIRGMIEWVGGIEGLSVTGRKLGVIVVVVV